MAEPVKEEKKETPETKGWLYKWTNYIKVLLKNYFTHWTCCPGISKALVRPSKWATFLLQKPGWDGPHVQVQNLFLALVGFNVKAVLITQRNNIFARSHHPHGELLLQLCCQQRRRHPDLPPKVTESEDDLVTIVSSLRAAQLGLSFWQKSWLRSLSGLPLR